MINLELSDSQKALQQTARTFADDVMKPRAQQADESGEFPIDVMQRAFEAGLLTESLPAQYGGGGHSALDTAIVAEELGAGCMGMTTGILANGLALAPLILFGNDDQKRQYFTPFTQRLQFAAFCLTERDAGSDAGSIQTTAIRDGDDYVLNGTKCFITNGGYADLFTVFASTDPTKGVRGITAFLVEKAFGVKVGKTENKMGQRASNQTEVHFENVRVPAANVLDREGAGFKVAMGTLDRTRTGVAAAAVGLARRALQESVAYARQRKQFGQPIAANQAIQVKLANMAMKVDASRLLVWQAALKADRGERPSRESAMAKCFAGDTAMDVTTEAVQIFGGNGYSKEYPVEKLMRDAKLMQIYEGTQEIQRLVIAKEVITKGE